MIIVLAGSSLFLLEFQFENQISLYVEKSGPFLGTSIPKSQGIDGNGVIVAVIDTGVDFNHPDLFGFGPDGKVIGGHNFIESNKLPSDTNGHGTQVAGIIAADGKISGIAPKSKILAYKVSEDGEGVQSELIVRAIKKAIEDGADIINISLGVNKTNSEIERAVNEALKKDIFVVTAAGNDGPKIGSIGSPGRNFGSITVGATYNNLTSSLVATLEVNEKSFTVIPMVGSKKLDEPITSEIIFAEYGRERDFEKLDAKDKIILVERGSDVEDEIVYFSTKEKNAARAGAKALIVYNKEPGIFLGELIHEFVESDYSPSIPVVSIDRQEGLEIKDMIKNENRGFLHLFFNPDFVAHFSSRGPVSLFHIKPDIVAPGAYINTTRHGGFYNFTSGTSYAAPHVSGAAALLIDKYPNISNNEIKSLLITTAEPVTNSLGEEFSIHDAGAGRLNIGKAINANLIIEPPNFVSVISSEQPTITKQLKLGAINGEIGDIEIDYEIPDFVKINHIIHEKNIELQISITTQNYGEHEGKIFIINDDVRYVVPFILHFTEASVSTNIIDNQIMFSINHPNEWSFAKITVTNSNTDEKKTTTITPQRKSSIKIYENGTYWIEASILSNDKIAKAYDIITVNTISEETVKPIIDFDLPEKQIGVLIIIIIGILSLGVYWKRIKKSQGQHF